MCDTPDAQLLLRKGFHFFSWVQRTALERRAQRERERERKRTASSDDDPRHRWPTTLAGPNFDDDDK